VTPERAAALVARWVRFYTRDLPPAIARRRVEEMDADLHDHIVHERAHGTSERRIALAVASRTVRGLAADASWRHDHATPEEDMTGHALRSTTAVRLAPALLLLLPAAAMLLGDDVNWGPIDFALAGVLLVGTGLLREVAARRTRVPAYRAAVGVALGAGLLLVWSAFAVGVIGEVGDGADLMYGGVLAVGLVGAALARLRPEGMARALLATALAQAVVALVALLAGEHQAAVTSVLEIVGVNGLFVALFLGSAALFRLAARTSAA
jgi:hypothetical protein